MLKTLWATVRDGKIELLEKVDVPDGSKVLVTLLEDDDKTFWQNVTQGSIDTVWNNSEDNVYEQLLKE